MKKYALFIGRYQGFHEGHKYLFQQKINEGIPVLIAIRDVEKDEKNPFTAEQVKYHIERELQEWILLGNCKVIIIPDIEGVYYGRDVGYKVEQIEAPEEIKQISATQVRKDMGL
jgi:nicotinamide mononucleotide adenylyltransferase